MDLLAWNLGNPDGNMTSLQQGNKTIQFHPMKGPMTTQTLRGLVGQDPYHWRGDMPNFAAFNSAFAGLLGGQQLSDADMAAFTSFINTIVYQPNPNQNLDGTMPNAMPLPDKPGVSANPNDGKTVFDTLTLQTGGTCGGCHADNPGTGSNLQVSVLGHGQGSQPFKTTQLRDLYQKTNLSFQPGAMSVNGYGFDHDGAVDGLIALSSGPVFGPISITDKESMEAYELCFETGIAPAVGYSRTLTSGNVTSGPAQSDWNTLQSQAAAGNIDLIAQGTIQGRIQGLLYQPASNNYQTGTAALGPFTLAQLTGFIQAGDTLTIMGVPPGSGVRMAISGSENR